MSIDEIKVEQTIPSDLEDIQPNVRPPKCLFDKITGSFYSIVCFVMSIPVSYTHLDVYKRQLFLLKSNNKKTAVGKCV